MAAIDEGILKDVREILGQEININKQGWAIYWCPKHPDEQRAGTSGEPNFGVDLSTGRYNCFRCGFKGGSLRRLAKELGSDYKPKSTPDGNFIRRKPKRESSGYSVTDVYEAVADAQSRILSSSALKYLNHRGVTSYTAMIYGLGHAVGYPRVSSETVQAGFKLGMIARNTWLWSESVIYADPVTNPKVLNVRYLPSEYMREGRPFKLGKHPHRTWGDRTTPLGAWRITPQTRHLVVVEGLFDMLVGAQFLDQKKLYPEYACVYTNGASPSFDMLQWFADHDYNYSLVCDMDKAGEGWVKHLSEAFRSQDRRYNVLFPPDGLDPDEAFLSGWWPPIIS
jgi:DNA primase